MAPRRIIADSDDEDDDLSPDVSPLRSPVHDVPPRNKHPGTPTITTGTSSTDSRFFQSVYDQQQESMNVIASLQFLARAREDPIQISSSSTHETLQPTASPTRPSEQQEKTASSSNIDLTQVMTPGRVQANAPPRDVWDVPSSAEEKGPYSGASARPLKRRKTGKNDNDNEAAALADKDQPTQPATSLYVEPRILSPSQRMLYQSIQTSSDEHNNSSQFAARYQQTGLANHSSGSATIAYPTPTQAKGSTGQSNPRMDPVLESPAEGRSRRARVPVEDPASSPDILAADDKPPPDARRKETLDEEVDSGTEELPQERYQPRPSRRRAAADISTDVDQTTAEELETDARALFDPGPDSIPPKRRRGRPRKSEEAPPPEVEGELASTAPPTAKSDKEEPVAEAEAVGQQEPTKVKRKRGRPRKADKEAKADTVPSPTEHGEAGTDAAEEIQKSKQGGAGDEVSGRGAAHEEGSHPATPPPADVESRPLQDKSVNQVGAAPPRESTTPRAALDKGRVDMGAEEVGNMTGTTKKGTKGGSSTPQQSTPSSKPLYRVGLSKRSRIAPLLKSLKKT